MPTRVLLLTRADCHLCDDARAVVEAVCAETGETWREVDIDADEALRAQYSDLVPVVSVDGVEAGYWRIKPHVVKAALTGAVPHPGGTDAAGGGE